MANVITSNPMHVDSTGALGIKGAVVLGWSWLSNEQTSRDIAVNDDLRLRLNTATGDVLVDRRALAAGSELVQTFPGGLKIPGDIYVDAIDGGTLFIYLK